MYSATTYRDHVRCCHLQQPCTVLPPIETMYGAATYSNHVQCCHLQQQCTVLPPLDTMHSAAIYVQTPHTMAQIFITVFLYFPYAHSKRLCTAFISSPLAYSWSSINLLQVPQRFQVHFLHGHHSITSYNFTKKLATEIIFSVRSERNRKRPLQTSCKITGTPL